LRGPQLLVLLEIVYLKIEKQDAGFQLQKAEIDIQELLDRKYKGAYFSVSVGEI
jgi:hypothetical protein